MSIKQPQLNFVFDRRHIASLNKKAPVELRVTYNYKQKYINTGIKLYTNQWKNKIVNCPDATQLNQVLDNLLLEVRQILLHNTDISRLQEELHKRNQKEMTFIEFCEQRAIIRKYGKSIDSQKRYDRFLRLFKQWGKIWSFDDISDVNIIMYDNHLISTGMKPYSKWNNYHRFLNGFIIDAINDGIIQRNPYKWINVNREKTVASIDKCLTLTEFRKIKNTTMPTTRLERIKDLFVFQTYTCLRYSDLAKFNNDNVIIISDTAIYKCVQKKTKKVATIPLLKPALDILNKYKGVLPIISNVKYNEYLKVVAQASSIDKPLTTHWARHTGATLLLNEGVDMKIVTKICGHTSTKITEQIYAKLLDETVINAIQDVKEKLEQ